MTRLQGLYNLATTLSFLYGLLPCTRLHEQSLCDRCCCPFIYIICICGYVTQKNLNGTLAVDSHFQTLVVDFSSNSWSKFI